MSRPIFSLVIVLALSVPSSLVAAVGDLYVGEARVDEDQRITTDSQLRALDEVLVRLTGRVNRSPVETLGLGSAELNSLLQSQHLVRHEGIDADGETVSELRVRVEFDQPAVNRLLLENGLARWGRERPAILLWMAIEDESSVRFVEDPYIEQLVREQARRLGLDVIRPLGDVKDMTEVTLPDVRGGFLGSSGSAASRYGAGVIAMLDLRRTGGRDNELWNARWFWRVRGVDSGFNRSGERVEDVIRSGMERLMADMAARFAVQDSGGMTDSRRLAVDGIVDVVQFAEVRRYLDALSIVDNVSVVQASGRRVVFELQLAGEGITDFLEMSGLLEPVQPAIDGHLYYRLRR